MSSSSDADAATPRDLAAKAWPWLAMLAVVVLCLVVATFRTEAPATAADRVTAVAKTIKCPTCQGESVADSNAETSRAIRADIADRVAAGQSDDEIRMFYAGRYGEEILLTPATSGITALVWILPIVAVACGIVALVLVFQRWRTASPARVTRDDRELVERAQRDAQP